jgi:hypothetical protein
MLRVVEWRPICSVDRSILKGSHGQLKWFGLQALGLDEVLKLLILKMKFVAKQPNSKPQTKPDSLLQRKWNIILERGMYVEACTGRAQ